MSERVRGFEVVTKYEGESIELPNRATKGSAGYDLKAAVDIVVPSIWKALLENQGLANLMEGNSIKDENKAFLSSTLVPTGVKAYMPEQEYLLLANRSSNPMKKQLALPNGIGIIDADYYGNSSNEGEIFVQLINYGFEDVEVKKGDRIAQGIFTPYEVIDNEVSEFQTRIGGFGSSGE
ncbi:dUTP diphosphatase [Marinilactibacillus sp. XAAS-LB27]|uniref:dUTP diphosphatase n=1 Tax=Marinilactibacillus sp. XAAS-LB27 TaxID=3114538 RepID=UPI002E175212|nr:dUTP diphosphatase [Marinilactibacillus sp. XAAS-LB27]